MKTRFFFTSLLIAIGFRVLAQCGVELPNNLRVCNGADISLSASVPAWDTVAVSNFFSKLCKSSDNYIDALSMGGIYSSNNKGNTWTQTYSTSSYSLTGLSVNTSGTGFCTGYSGTTSRVLFTADGDSWSLLPQSFANTVLYDIETVADNHAVAAGRENTNAGAVYISTDYGINWTKLSGFPGTGYVPIALDFDEQTNLFPADNTGFVCGVGMSGKIWRTNDSGETWTEKTQTSDFLNFQNLYAIEQVSETKIVSAGANQSIYKSEDGGDSWQKIKQTAVFEYFVSIDFYDELHGYITGDHGSVWFTEDGGNTWNPAQLSGSGNMSCVIAVSENEIYVSNSNNKLYRKLAHSFSWTPVEFLDNPTTQNPVATINQNTTFTLSYSNNYGCSTVQSTDVEYFDFEMLTYGDVLSCGQAVPLNTYNNYQGSEPVSYDWSNPEMLDNPAVANPMATVDETTYFEVSGSIPGANCTAETGITVFYEPYTLTIPETYTVIEGENIQLEASSPVWMLKFPYWSLWEIDQTRAYFIDENIGYVAGKEGTISKTNDGANSWIPLNSPTSEDIFDIWFSSENKGIICGTEFIYTTENGGETWESIGSKTAVTFTSIYFPTSENGFILSDYGACYKTSNAGTTWTWQQIVVGEKLVAMHFLSGSQTGYLLTKHSTSGVSWLYKTTNGGETWNPLKAFNDSGALNDVAFTDENTGFIAGEHCLKTTDGGTTWTEFFLTGEFSHFLDLHFLDSQTGYLLNKAEIFKTTDGGNTWKSQEFEDYTQTLLNFCILDENTGFVTSSARIYKNVSPQYTWTPATYLSATDIENPICSPASSILYSVQSVSSEGCSAENQTSVDVLTSTNQSKDNSDFEIFPNPISQNFTVKYFLDKKTSVKIRIISSNGKVHELLCAENRTSGLNFENLEMPKDWSSGFYFLEISTPEKTMRRSLIFTGK